MKTVTTTTKCGRFEETVSFERGLELLGNMKQFKSMKKSELKKMVKVGNVTVVGLHLVLFFA